MINFNRGTWTLWSATARDLSFCPQRQHSVPLWKLPGVLPIGSRGLCIVRLAVKHNRFSTIIPALPSTPFPVRSCRRKLRVSHLLELICPYAFSRDPRGSDPPSQFSYTSGPSPALGNSYPRFEDGSGIWSGQGPGPSLDALLLQELDFQRPSSYLDALVQIPNNSLLGAPHGAIGSSFTQTHHYAPDPPVPLQQGALRELISKAFSAGFALGLSFGNTHTTPQEATSNGFKSQQSNPPREMQEENTSASHHSTLSMLLGLPHEGATRISALPLGEFSAPVHETSASPEVSLSLDLPDQPMANSAGIANIQALTGDTALDAWLQQPALTIGDGPILDSHSAVPFAAGTYSLDGDIGSGAEAGPSMNPVDSSLAVFQSRSTHPTTPNTRPESQLPDAQFNQGNNGGFHRCSRCGKAFRRPYLLKDHMRAHDNERPHRCTVGGCGRRYASRAGLMRHLNKRHHNAVHSQDPPSPGYEQTHSEIPRQTPEAGPSNHGAFGGNTHSSPAFIPYTPSSTRHKRRQHDE